MDKTYGKVDSGLLTGLTEQQRSSVLNWEAYNQFQQAMNDIIWQMKEIPVLPSSIPPEDDKFTLQRVEIPQTGGVLTYMDKMPAPFKGFPYSDFVGIIDLIKKLIKGFMSGLYHTHSLRSAPIYAFCRLIERYKIKTFRYSDAIRELNRAFSYPRNDGLKTKDLRLMIRDVLCMILEFDNAYRYRAQDLLVEINKDNLKKHPIRELNRLADIAISREKERQVIDTWNLIKLFNNFYLRFDFKLKSMVVDVLSELDYEQFKLKPEDMVFCNPRKDYVFGYMK